MQGGNNQVHLQGDTMKTTYYDHNPVWLLERHEKMLQQEIEKLVQQLEMVQLALRQKRLHKNFNY